MAMTLDTASGVVARAIDLYFGAYTYYAAASDFTSAGEQDYHITTLAALSAAHLREAVSNDLARDVTFAEALEQVVIQAIAQSESFNASTVGTTPTDATTANSFRLVSAYVARFNQPYYNHRNHSLVFQCISAPIRNIGNYTSKWQLTSDPLLKQSFVGLTGLGYSGLITPASAQLDGTSHQANVNILVNGGFERFTSNAPDMWEVVTGTAGTHFNAVTTPYIGTNALRFIGDAGATLTKVRHQIGNSTGTTGTTIELQPRTQYAITAMVRRYGTGAITGTLRLSIEDSGGTERYSSGVALDLSTATTTYTQLSTTFYTGDLLTATNYAVVELTTALGSTHEVFIDELIVAPMIVIPGHGRQLLCEGSAASSIADRYTIARSNDYTGRQLYILEYMYDMATAHDLCPPVNAGGAETILDTYNVGVPE